MTMLVFITWEVINYGILPAAFLAWLCATLWIPILAPPFPAVMESMRNDKGLLYMCM